MTFTSALILLGVAMVLAAITWGAFAAQRSLIVPLLALPVAGLAALLSWYSAVESQSVLWTVGYGAVAALAIAVAGRHLVGRKT
jgi:hypothetical protein